MVCMLPAIVGRHACTDAGPEHNPSPVAIDCLVVLSGEDSLALS